MLTLSSVCFTYLLSLYLLRSVSRASDVSEELVSGTSVKCRLTEGCISLEE